MRWESSQVREGWSKPILARDDTLEWEQMTSRSKEKLDKRVIKAIKWGFLEAGTGMR